MLRAAVCWPWCSETTYQRVHESVGAHAKAYKASITTAQQLESLFVQVYARLFVGGEGYSIPKLPFQGARTDAVCYVYEHGSSMSPAEDFDEGTFLADGADREELERVIRAFEKPMLTYDGFEKNNDARTRDLAAQAYALRQAAWKAGMSDALFYGDVAMLCYGLRRAAPSELRAIVPDDLVSPDKKILSQAGVKASTMAVWAKQNSVLVHYNGIDMNAVARKDFSYFMGLKIPTADSSLHLALAMYGSRQADSHLLDAMMLKSIAGSDLPLPCLFGNLVAAEGLSYSPRLDGLIKAYEASRSLVAARLCPDGARDLNFHVRNAANAKGEFEAARKIQAALKGLPVTPAYYGTIECSGKTKIAIEPFDMTLETWMSKERTASAWLEVLTRIVWCVLALEGAEMHHSKLEPKNVLLRSTECLMRPKAPSALLMQASLPDSSWDVRLSGIQHIKSGAGNSRGGVKSLAKIILNNAFLLPVEIADTLKAPQTTAELAELLDQQVIGYSALRRARAPKPAKKK